MIALCAQDKKVVVWTEAKGQWTPKKSSCRARSGRLAGRLQAASWRRQVATTR